MLTIRTMHHSSTSEIQRQVVVRGIVTSCDRVGHKHSRLQRMKDCRTRSNKSGVLTMSFKATTIHAVRSSTVGPPRHLIHKQFEGVPEEKVPGIESGKRGYQVIGSLRPIHFPEKAAWI
ncbi:hypothetical protein TNCV_3442251 [Trichonephila clavipes]|nr:hypothetical protein TNCV_3442251 [Trichonephila clavipes]